MSWTASKVGVFPKLRNTVLIEGLPGIGNVGKVAVDFLIDDFRAKRMFEFFSYSMPHSVFVNEDNLVDLPVIALYHKRIKGRDVLLLGGDVQPVDERSSYEFSEFVLDTVSKFGCNEIITLGGIGLPAIPNAPKVYCTGNCDDIVKKYTAGVAVRRKLFGVVGPVVGVSGLLLGLAKRRNIKAASLLAETYGHPMYLGLRGAREIIKVLDKKLSLSVNLKGLDREIGSIEKEMGKNRATGRRQAKGPIGKIQQKLGEDVNYIG